MLREDAATTALTLKVDVRERVVTLVGTVDGHEDAEAAETVVWHVPGVVDVHDEIKSCSSARERREKPERGVRPRFIADGGRPQTRLRGDLGVCRPVPRISPLRLAQLEPCEPRRSWPRYSVSKCSVPERRAYPMAMTANGNSRISDDEVALVAALLLVGDGIDPTELAARFKSMSMTVGHQSGAAAVLTSLATLGLVRISRHGDDAHYVRTALGQQHARATLAGEPELTGGLAMLERLRTDLLSAVAHELRTPLTALERRSASCWTPIWTPNPR